MMIRFYPEDIIKILEKVGFQEVTFEQYGTNDNGKAYFEAKEIKRALGEKK